MSVDRHASPSEPNKKKEKGGNKIKVERKLTKRASRCCMACGFCTAGACPDDDGAAADCECDCAVCASSARTAGGRPARLAPADAAADGGPVASAAAGGGYALGGGRGGGMPPPHAAAGASGGGPPE